MGAKGGKLPNAGQPQGARQLRMSSSSLGQVIPLIYGENRTASNLLFAFMFTAIPHNGGPSGGKSGGRSVFVQYTYAVSGILALCEGALDLDAGIPASDPQQAVVIGRATPGAQVITVSDKSGKKAKAQPAAGVAPGLWVLKRVRWVVNDAGKGLADDGDDIDDTDGFRPIRWHDFGTGQFVTAPGDTLNFWKNRHSLNPNGGQQKAYDRYITDAGENYFGIACVARQNMRLGSNASIPSYNFPVRGLQQYRDIYPAESGGSSDTEANQLYGADPACILLDLLTNPKHGAGWDKGGFTAFLQGWPTPWGAKLTGGSLVDDAWSTYCRAQNLVLSPLWDSQRSMADLLTDLAEATNTAIVWSEARLKMIPYGDTAVTSSRTGVTFTPTNDPEATTDGANIAVRYVLTLDDIVPGKDGAAVVWEGRSVVPDPRGDYQSDGYFNHIRVEFLNAANAYAVEVAEAKDEAAIAVVGVVSREPIQRHEITSAEIAQDVAERELQRSISVRSTCTIKLPFRFMLLEPMDVIQLPAEEGSERVRITSVSEDTDGLLEIEAETAPGDFAASALPTNPVNLTIYPDLGGIILGGKGTISQANNVNPQYTDLTGTVLCYQTMPAGEWYAEPQGWWITEWDVWFQSEMWGGSNTQRVASRLRFNIDGVSRPELEVAFDPADKGTIKRAVGRLYVPRHGRVCVEILYSDGGAVFAVGGSTQYREHGFNWSIAWEPET